MNSKMILIALVISVTPSAYALGHDEEANKDILTTEQAIELQTQTVFQTEEVNEVLREVRYESSQQRLNTLSEKLL